MGMSPVHQVWPKPSCKEQWKGEEDKADRGRGGKTTSGNGQAWSSAISRGQWRTGKNGENWLQNNLWCPKDPRGYGIDDDDDDIHRCMSSGPSHCGLWSLVVCQLTLCQVMNKVHLLRYPVNTALFFPEFKRPEVLAYTAVHRQKFCLSDLYLPGSLTFIFLQSSSKINWRVSWTVRESDVLFVIFFFFLHPDNVDEMWVIGFERPVNLVGHVRAKHVTSISETSL